MHQLTVGGRRRPAVLALLVAALAVLALLVGACTTSSSEGSDDTTPDTTEAPVPQPDPVALTVTATVQGQEVLLEGTATVPDGAKVSYELRHPSLLDPAVCQGAGQRCLAVGAAPVESGRYTATVDLAGWPAGEVSVWTGFQMELGLEEGQPAEIVELYGENGERITGESVVEVGEERHAEARTTITVG